MRPPLFSRPTYVKAHFLNWLSTPAVWRTERAALALWPSPVNFALEQAEGMDAYSSSPAYLRLPLGPKERNCCRLRRSCLWREGLGSPCQGGRGCPARRRASKPCPLRAGSLERRRTGRWKADAGSTQTQPLKDICSVVNDSRPQASQHSPPPKGGSLQGGRVGTSACCRATAGKRSRDSRKRGGPTASENRAFAGPYLLPASETALQLARLLWTEKPPAKVRTNAD